MICSDLARLYCLTWVSVVSHKNVHSFISIIPSLWTVGRCSEQTAIVGKREVLGYFIEFTAVYIIQLFFSTNDYLTSGRGSSHSPCKDSGGRGVSFGSPLYGEAGCENRDGELPANWVFFAILFSRAGLDDEDYEILAKMIGTMISKLLFDVSGIIIGHSPNHFWNIFSSKGKNVIKISTERPRRYDGCLHDSVTMAEEITLLQTNRMKRLYYLQCEHSGADGGPLLDFCMGETSAMCCRARSQHRGKYRSAALEETWGQREDLALPESEAYVVKRPGEDIACAIILLTGILHQR
ncbi:hypothetical protein E1301_Tti000340 [Triplophysa tibetana]|uniref:Uncharacterized protein n=1 Tax=Triplophysa tibetana TaxID=1572043 RepID=A0A5A9N521_9TELE|nr:hypothetical protein E1301_Tti000340 [Triplophysa tibetana]